MLTAANLLPERLAHRAGAGMATKHVANFNGPGTRPLRRSRVRNPASHLRCRTGMLGRSFLACSLAEGVALFKQIVKIFTVMRFCIESGAVRGAGIAMRVVRPTPGSRGAVTRARRIEMRCRASLPFPLRGERWDHARRAHHRPHVTGSSIFFWKLLAVSF